MFNNKKVESCQNENDTCWNVYLLILFPMWYLCSIQMRIKYLKHFITCTTYVSFFDIFVHIYFALIQDNIVAEIMKPSEKHFEGEKSCFFFVLNTVWVFHHRDIILFQMRILWKSFCGLENETVKHTIALYYLYKYTLLQSF